MGKRIFVLTILFLFILALLSGCAAQSLQTSSAAKGNVLTAKIRYFDGSTETLVLNGYAYGYSSMVVLYTVDGRKIAVAPNNVIIIEESESQYNQTD